MHKNIGRHSTIRVAALEGVAAMVAMAGGSLHHLLRQQGIESSVMDDPENRLQFSQMTQVLDAAARVTGDDCFGLHMGMAQSPEMLGVLGYAMRASPNVQSMIGHLSRFCTLHQDGAVFELSLSGDSAMLTYSVLDEHVILHRHDTESCLAIAVSQCRSHVGQPNWSPRSVHFEHPAPGIAAQHELARFFGCALYFSEPYNGLRFPSAFLATPLHTADAGLSQVLLRYAEESLTLHTDHFSLVGRARRRIAAGLGSGQANIQEVARHLSMTPRTLQRHLVEEGTRFNLLVDATRKELAARYLADSNLPSMDVAFLLGYSDVTAFHRAFRRWFGQTPQAYLRQQGVLSSSDH